MADSVSAIADTDLILHGEAKSVESHEMEALDQMEVADTSETTEYGTDFMIYSTVTATLSPQVISAIHGNKVEFLSSILKMENITFHFIPESQIYCLTGMLKDIVKCQDCLKTLIEGLKQGLPANNIYESLMRTKEETQENTKVDLEAERKFDKGVNCEILKAPIVTRSGRVVKRSKNDVNDFIKVDDLSVDGDSDSNEVLEEQSVKERKTELKKISYNRKKRGRPPRKVQQVDGDDHSGEDETTMVQDKPGAEQDIDETKTQEADLFKADDILHQSLTLTKALENEIRNSDSIGDSLPDTSSGSFNIKDLDGTSLKEGPEDIPASNSSEQKLDSLTSEVGKAVKESFQNVYLNKSVTEKEKIKRGRKSKSSNDEKSKMQEIKQSYEKKMPYKYFCTKCSFKSKRESHFKLHKKLHASNPDMSIYKCDQCDFTAIRQSVLHKHKVSHLENYLSCKSCEYKTNNSVHLSNHIKNRHGPRSEETQPSSSAGEWFSCNVCPYRTKRYSTYTKHYLSHGLTFSASEDGKVLTFKCNLCSYKTQRKEHLVRHKSDAHGNNRPYLCDLCGMAFKRIDALAAHKLTHLDKSQRSLPFKCNACKKAFKSRAHLKEHLAVHTSLRAYLCDICGVSFKTRAVQKKHQQNIHLNPGSFKCNTCPKAFNTKYALQRHIQHHEYSTPYKSRHDLAKTPKEEEIQVDPFGVEVQGHIDDQGQGDDLQVQEVQLQFHLQEYGGQVTLVPEDGQLVNKDEGQRLQIIEGHEFNSEQVQGHDLEGQLLEQVQDENMDENLTAIQTITLPSSQLRQLAQPIHTSEGEEIYIQNFPTDDGDSFVDPSRDTVRQLFIPSSIDGQASVIEVDGNTTFIQEIQGTESLIEEVKSLGALEGMQPNRAILTINTDGIEKVFVTNVSSGDVENL